MQLITKLLKVFGPHSSFNISFQATESIEQLMYLYQTDSQEVQEAAMQSLLELGKDNQFLLQSKDKIFFFLL